MESAVESTNRVKAFSSSWGCNVDMVMMIVLGGEPSPLKELPRELEGEVGAEAVYCLEDRFEDPCWGDIFFGRWDCWELGDRPL